MDFEIPSDIQAKLAELDAFIEREIKPLERENVQFFDHRREHARTDWDNGGLPRPEWEALLEEMRRRADAAGHYRFALPREYGGRDGSNLAMARIRDDSHPVYRDAEWQADTFAGGLLMSARHLARLGCAEDAATQCGMTPMAADVMWSKYQKEGLLS